MQSAAVAGCGGRHAMGLAEQFGELFGDGAAKLFGVDDGDGAAVVARDVVADADRDQFDRRAGLDLLDDMAQMALEVIAGIDRHPGIVDPRSPRKKSPASHGSFAGPRARQYSHLYLIWSPLLLS